MGLYYEGLSEALTNVRAMSEDELLKHLDALYGRSELPEGYGKNDLLHEALEQTRRDFTDTSSPEYDRVQFWTKVAKAGGI